MLYTFDRNSHALVPVTEPPHTGWVHAALPSTDELTRLRDDLGVPPEFLRHALDANEVARVDRSGAASLVMLRVPWQNGTQASCRAAPLGVVMLDHLIVTITPLAECEVVRDVLALPDLEPERAPRFLFSLVLCAAERFLTQLQKIDGEIERLEDELETSQTNEKVLGLLTYQKGLVHFTSALASNRIMLERLQTDVHLPIHLPISEDDRNLLEDALVELRQAVEMATISENVLRALTEAFAAIISNNLNHVMKLLTAATIVMTVPMVLSSLYGMNVALPGQHGPFAFATVVCVSVAVAALVIAFFRLKRWI